MAPILKSISGVLLAYNEEEIIASSISRLSAVFETIAQEYEIVVVGYEGSSDRTNQTVKDLSLKDSRIRLVLQRKEDRGYGGAFALGVKSARFEWIFQSDADGQYRFESLPSAIAATDLSRVGVLHGYRKKRQDPTERILFAALYNLYLRLLYPLSIKDVDSAYKLIRREAATTITLKAKTGFAIAEFLLKVQKLGFEIVQIPIEHLPRRTGTALSDKGVSNPLNLQIPRLDLITGTLGEALQMRRELIS